ncbi:chaperone modulator CbpM [Pedobacter jejuensis]|uniref:MerR family transcriptional regulator n=1 Tax=Pedobacter jejuensis TaxID=1268550 RepID=A0A3N0C2R5_9SPHI|nr:chaperone modulator CbpM [Pedobacter jejuensis]RNL56042.1 MerR family transcriptional regulator [Pedobacter jejuensis]
METEHLVPLEIFCLYNEVEISFIYRLHEFGIVNVFKIAQQDYLLKDELADLEKMIRLHQELEINLEGLHAIKGLLEQIAILKIELKMPITAIFPDLILHN